MSWKSSTAVIAAAVGCAGLLQACGGGGGGGSVRLAPELIEIVNPSDVPPYQGPVTELPPDVTRLYALSGNASSSTVVLFLQGGPVDFLVPEEGLDDLHPVLTEHTLVRVHQANTLNPSIVANPDLSYARAIRENEVSVEILNRVIRHFAAQGRRVQVVSHSFGSFLVLRAWARHPALATLVDRFLVLNGRLDMPDVVWQGMRRGEQWGFPDGGEPALAANQPTRETREGDDNRAPGDPPQTQTFSLSQLKLEADIGRLPLTRELAGRSLNRLIMVESTADRAVGRLSEDERRFLAAQGATRYCIAGGTHDSAFEAPYAQELAALLDGTSTRTRDCAG
ncbi:alpha/beta fold hydrolase [Roseateles amylovorans]|uniref:AB hydrolase-1 domain-containing protein n=1 Tax=Roseateles amylovorans TaxID=2978473 RepID=A0ABY6B5L3_9BURK|nr:alpha/beta fold hydrolase [Roseateles amylovorans]UXH79235.1 hypothetical protein N4261_04680 [Roseateles amylovorans]